MHRVMPNNETSLGMLGRWNRFWFTAADPIPLHVVRMLFGLVMLGWLLPYAGHVTELFGIFGWVDQQGLVEISRTPEPPLKLFDWSPIYLAGSPILVHALYWGTIGLAVLLTLGVAPRLVAPLAWLATVAFSTQPVAIYGGDMVLLVLSFYVMVGCLLSGLRSGPRTVGNFLFGPASAFVFSKKTAAPSVGANLAIRMLQVHVAIMVASAALHKLQIPMWWAGHALWFPAHSAFDHSLEQILAWKDRMSPEALMVFVSLASYGVLAWQFSFPALVWYRRWQPVYIVGALIGWAGSVFLYHMPVFGPAMLVATLAFVPADVWRKLTARGQIRLTKSAPAPKRELAETAA